MRFHCHEPRSAIGLPRREQTREIWELPQRDSEANSQSGFAELDPALTDTFELAAEAGVPSHRRSVTLEARIPELLRFLPRTRIMPFGHLDR